MTATDPAVVSALDDLYDDGPFHLVHPDDLDPAPDNPRRDLGDLTELAESVKTLGVVQAISATPRDGRLMIVCGHRRHAAARLAGLATVPVVVEDMDDTERVARMIEENRQRQGLTPIEEALAFKHLVDLGVKQKDLGKRFGVSQPTVSKRLKLLKLPEAAQLLLDRRPAGTDAAVDDSGRMTIEQAEALADLPAEKVAALCAKGRVPKQWEIDEARHQVDRERKIAKATAELEAAGIPIVELGTLSRKGPCPLDWIYDSGDQDADAAKIEAHAGEPCHAAGFQYHATEPLLVCTDPARHPEAKPARGGYEPDPEEEARRRAEDDAARVAAESRRSFLRALLAGPGWQAGAGEHLARWAIGTYEREYDAEKTALDLLGETAVGDDDQEDAEALADQFAARADTADDTEALRLGLAVALADIEAGLTSRWGRWGSPNVARHFRFLEARGYRSSDWERAKVRPPAEAEADPDPDLAAVVGEEPRSCRECGCTDDFACDGGCSWVEDDLCSRCAHPDQHDNVDVGAADESIEASADTAPTVAVAKAGRKWKVVCSDHGEIARQTTRQYADQAAERHLANDHPAEAAAAVEG